MAEDSKNIEGEEEGGGGGKKKLIIIIVAVVVLLLGGAAAAFLLMGGDDEPAAEGAAEQAEEQLPQLEEGEPLYVEMEPQFVVNLPPGGPAKMLQLSVSVYTRHQEVSDFLAANAPMLRHHMIDLLEEQQSRELMTAEGKAKLQQSILEMLTAKLKEFKQPGEVKGVYFTAFVLQ